MVCLMRVGIGGEDDVPWDTAPKVLGGKERYGIYAIERRPDGSLDELGRGAMGVTYRAVDTSLQRKVALKIIKTDVAGRSAEARERFMREARAAAALRHENIATVFQFGIREETGQCFYAMELIEGETLDERVRRTGPLSVPTTIDIAQQVTAALIAAEKHGLVHRDLKPANLMLLSPDGGTVGIAENNENLIVKIIDFGLAKALNAPDDPMRLTRDGFVGTPAFASPEQFEKHAALDVRADIYSLGVTLWFALTGKTPFAGSSVEEIHRAQKSNALPIEQLKAAHVPSRLRSLLESMLALEPAARPGAHDLATRLQRCSPQASVVRRTRVALAAAFVLFVGVSTLLVFRSLRTHPATAESASSLATDKSIAVLPFENLSRDPDNAFFADGIQEEILTRLAKIADLRVISRTSTQPYQSKPRNLSKIAKQLGVANIVEGSVQRAADQVRVNVQLINAQTDSHLWAESYDRKLTDILGVESEIAKGIAESLRARLTGREQQALAAKSTNNPEAYDAYLRGVAFEARSLFTATDLLWKAIGFYEHAVQLDPNFSLAWARLSRAHSLTYFTRADTGAARRDAAKNALDHAQKLEPNSPETKLALGYYQYWVVRDYGLAKSTFQLVGKMLPRNTDVSKAVGLVAQREGNWSESVASWEEALALDPRNTELLSNAALAYTRLRQFPAALKLYDRALDIVPNDPELMALKAGVYQGQGNLAQAARVLSTIGAQTPSEGAFAIKMVQLRLERNHSEAIRLLQTRQHEMRFGSEIEKCDTQMMLSLAQRIVGDSAGAKRNAEQTRNTLGQLWKNQPDNASLAAMLSVANAVLGEKDAALKEAERAIMLLPSAKDRVSGPDFEENLATIQMIFGETSRPISTLTRLLQTPYSGWFYNGTPVTPALLRLDPIWDPLRADPAFQKLCQDKQP